MDQNSKLLIAFFVVFIAISIAFTYYKYIIMNDFPVIEEVAEEGGENVLE